MNNPGGVRSYVNAPARYASVPFPSQQVQTQFPFKQERLASIPPPRQYITRSMSHQPAVETRCTSPLVSRDRQTSVPLYANPTRTYTQRPPAPPSTSPKISMPCVTPQRMYSATRQYASPQQSEEPRTAPNSVVRQLASATDECMRLRAEAADAQRQLVACHESRRRDMAALQLAKATADEASQRATQIATMHEVCQSRISSLTEVNAALRDARASQDRLQGAAMSTLSQLTERVEGLARETERTRQQNKSLTESLAKAERALKEATERCRALESNLEMWMGLVRKSLQRGGFSMEAGNDLCMYIASLKLTNEQESSVDSMMNLAANHAMAARLQATGAFGTPSMQHSPLAYLAELLGLVKPAVSPTEVVEEANAPRPSDSAQPGSVEDLRTDFDLSYSDDGTMAVKTSHVPNAKVPSLGLRAVGHGSWLGGELTAGDTYSGVD